jgi:hypothetical protein
VAKERGATSHLGGIGRITIDDKNSVQTACGASNAQAGCCRGKLKTRGTSGEEMGRDEAGMEEIHTEIISMNDGCDDGTFFFATGVLADFLLAVDMVKRIRKRNGLGEWSERLSRGLDLRGGGGMERESGVSTEPKTPQIKTWSRDALIAYLPQIEAPSDTSSMSGAVSSA